MELKVGSNGTYYLVLGCMFVGRKVKPVRLDLGSNKDLATQRAARIWTLWQRQDGMWTDQGLKQADLIATGFRP